MELVDEKNLVEQARSNPEVFSQIYDWYYPKIFNYVLRRTADFNVAQDITSEAFYKILKNLWRFQWMNISFSAWIYRIATNEINNHYRKNKNKTESLDHLMEEKGYDPQALETADSELIEAQQILQQHQDFLHAQKVIQTLPLKYQEVLTLRFFEQKQIKEIGDILGKSEGTVKSQLHRGLAKVKEQLEATR